MIRRRYDLDPDAMTDEERRAKRRFEAGFVFETMPTRTVTIHHLAFTRTSAHVALCNGLLPDSENDTSLVAERVTCPECRRIAGLGPQEEEPC